MCAQSISHNQILIVRFDAIVPSRVVSTLFSCASEQTTQTLILDWMQECTSVRDREARAAGLVSHYSGRRRDPRTRVPKQLKFMMTSNCSYCNMCSLCQPKMRKPSRAPHLLFESRALRSACSNFKAYRPRPPTARHDSARRHR